MIRVVIADDQELVRTGFRVILSQTPDLQVVGEAATGRQAIDTVRRTLPDVVLMDIRMPDLDGIEATRRIRATVSADGPPRILILTTFDLDEYVFAGLQGGASGFLLKDTRAADLLAAIRTVAAGDAVTAPTITRRLIAHFVNSADHATSPDDSPLHVLTPRERDVLTLISQGQSNREIAHTLRLSEGTVKGHVNRILTKLELRDRVQAVILGYRYGLVTTSTHSLDARAANPKR